jgi:exosortase/archaeosortase family protein
MSSQAQDLQNQNSSALNYWAAGWSILLFMLLAHAAPAWIEVVSKNDVGKNWIPLFSFPVLVFGIYKYWKSRPTFAESLDNFGLLFLFVTSIVTAFASYFAFERLSWAGLLAMIIGVLWSIAGRNYYSYWSPVLLFSVEILPGAPLAAEQWATSHLQRLSAQFAGDLAGLFIPITTLANSFTIKDNTYQIAPACTGLSLWTSFVFIILLWNLFKPVKSLKLFSIVALSVMLSMVLNAARLSITALVAYHWNSQTALAIHTNLDFILFPIGLAVLALAWGLKRE